MRIKYKSRQSAIAFDITPLIDVVFLLIIFFMVTSSFVQVSGIRVRLPEAGSSKELTERNFERLEIDAKGRVFLNDKVTAFDKVENYFDGLEKSSVIQISADSKTDFGDVMKIWDLARQKGFKEVIVVTTKKKG